MDCCHNSCQISILRRTPIKSYRNPVEISLKSHEGFINPIEIPKSHRNPMKIPEKSHENPIHTSTFLGCGTATGAPGEMGRDCGEPPSLTLRGKSGGGFHATAGQFQPLIFICRLYMMIYDYIRLYMIIYGKIFLYTYIYITDYLQIIYQNGNSEICVSS